MKNSNLNEESGSLFFLLFIKMSGTTYYQKNID